MINYEKITRFELRKLISERRLLLEDDPADSNSQDFSLNANITTIEEDTAFRQWVNSKTRETDKGGEYKKAIGIILKKEGLRDSKLDPESEQIRNDYVKAIWNSNSFTTGEGENKRTITYGQAYLEEKKESSGISSKIKNKEFNNWDQYNSIIKKFCDQGREDDAMLLTFGYLFHSCQNFYKDRSFESEEQRSTAVKDAFNKGKVLVNNILNAGKVISEESPGDQPPEGSKAENLSTSVNKELVKKGPPGDQPPDGQKNQ